MGAGVGVFGPKCRCGDFRLSCSRVWLGIVLVVVQPAEALGYAEPEVAAGICISDDLFEELRGGLMDGCQAALEGQLAIQ